MTWKRIVAAVVLIPAVVGLVLSARTAWVAIALAPVMLLALFEFFALGDAIGHRAYKFWTAVFDQSNGTAPNAPSRRP